MENNNEWEQMRDQLELLKGKLEKQELVNERLIADSMKHKMSWIKKLVYIEFFGLPLLALLWIGIKHQLGLSWWNVVVLVVCCFLDTLADYIINIKSIKDEDYAQNNLIDTIQKLQHMKHSRFVQMLIGLPTLILFMGWTIYEALQNVPMADKEWFVFSFSIGLSIGIAITICLYWKLQKTNDEVIKDINDLQAE